MPQLIFIQALPNILAAGASIALYDGCDSYGVTAHLMNEKIVNGSILECRRFPVHASDSLSSVLDRTHSELKGLCLYFVTHISVKGADFIDERLRAAKDLKWRGDARRMSELAELQSINPGVGVDELKKIVRATYIEGFPPKINLHGYEFALVSDKKKGD